MEFNCRNVNDAFRDLIREFDLGINVDQNTSRNGPVLVLDEPVTMKYRQPRERVLLNPARDANPFFHLYEALWMLAGRNDVAGPSYYARQMKEYSDDGRTLNGAYGYRWRKAGHTIHTGEPHPEAQSAPTWETSVDQLSVLINHLRAQPNSRRAVLQMWNVEDDLLKIGFTTGAPDGDMDSLSKDVCCNLSVMFSLRESSAVANLSALNLSAEEKARRWGTVSRALDMTVTNRSNDLVWGMLGANYVHFSFLQEYIACALGAEVGRYYHFTNNLHVYTEGLSGWKPDEWLAGCTSIYPATEEETVRLYSSPDQRETFDRECGEFVTSHDGTVPWDETADAYSLPFFRLVAYPMMSAFRSWKLHRDYRAAYTAADRVASPDWRQAAFTWLDNRKKKEAAK